MRRRLTRAFKTAIAFGAFIVLAGLHTTNKHGNDANGTNNQRHHDGKETRPGDVRAQIEADAAEAERQRPTEGDNSPSSSTATDDNSSFNPSDVRDGLPDRTEANPKTQGWLFDPDGNEHYIISGNNENTGAINDALWRSNTNPPLNSDHPAATHVEPQAAYIMNLNRDGESTYDLVINNDNGPCPGDYGCDDNLSGLIPPGMNLNVHWRDHNGNMQSQTYPK